MLLGIGHAADGKSQILFIGLTKENLRRLQMGMPITCSEKSHPGGVLPPGWELFICYGDTEQAIGLKLAAGSAGMPSAENVKIDPRLNQGN